MSSVFDLLGIFELIVDGLDDGSLSQHQFIPEAHQMILHVASNACDEMNTLLEW